MTTGEKKSCLRETAQPCQSVRIIAPITRRRKIIEENTGYYKSETIKKIYILLVQKVQ